jgi:hypothetical protein
MSDFTHDSPSTHAYASSSTMDSNRATYPPSGGKALTKAGKRARKVQNYKRGKSSRRQRNKFPNYDRHRSPQQELIKVYGGELDDGMELDKVDGEEKSKEKDMDSDKESKENGKIYNIPLRTKANGASTLAQLRQRHDELAKYINDTKKSTALGQEALMKEKARHSYQKMKKEQQEAAVEKEDEKEMDIDIS